jgi:hypothetical protein
MTALRNGIKNEPNAKQLANMRLLAENIFEPTRAALGGRPIALGSFYRCLELNARVGGSKNSQHMALRGAAMDLDADHSPYLHNYQIFEYIQDNLIFDQLIWEFGTKYNPDWVHVSFNKGKNRNKVMRAYRDVNGKARYELYKY